MTHQAFFNEYVILAVGVDTQLRTNLFFQSLNPKIIFCLGENPYVATNFIRHLTNFRRSDPGLLDAFDSERRRIFSIFRDLQDVHSFAPFGVEVKKLKTRGPRRKGRKGENNRKDVK